jgi:hypothetical protein
MSTILSTLLFAGAATAQVTTSFLYPVAQYGTDKIGFLGSVISVSGTHTALEVRFDNGTNLEQLNFSNEASNLTLSDTQFELVRNVEYAEDKDFANAYEYKIHCDVPTSAAPKCTEFYGPVVARNVLCESWAWKTPTYLTYLFEYSARSTYAAGTQTIVNSVAIGPTNTAVPTWCSDEEFYPSSGFTFEPSMKKEDLATYQLVITAGLEKLSATTSATQGASSSGPSPTVGGASGGSTGAAMPMKTMGPMGPVMAGLGAAAAIFL